MYQLILVKVDKRKNKLDLKTRIRELKAEKILLKYIGMNGFSTSVENMITYLRSTYIRGFRWFLDIKVSRYCEGYSFSAKLRQLAGQTQDNFNFGPRLLKFS